MDEMNNLPEKQNNEEIKDQSTPTPTIVRANKLPIIIGCVIAVVAIIVAVILGNGKVHSEPVISVIDGYVAVNGVKTEHKVHTEPVISVIDGYVAVNGVKTEYEINNADIITVEGGYVVVNGVKTEHMVHTEPSISVIDGYVAVNGVITEYKVELECSHDWQTVTTPPTCTEDGYDIMTCSVCEKKIKTNEVKGGHKFNSTYTIDDNYHWYECINCEAMKGKEYHTVDDYGVCTVCQLPVSSTPGIIYDISADGTYAEVIGYEGTAKKIRIADTYKDLPVKSIASKAFYENETITSVIIPDGVISIGDYAFLRCNLTSIVIPDGVTSIGKSAFYSCPLRSIEIPDSVITIGNSAFWGCDHLTSIVIPDGVTSIVSDVFYSCENLTSIVIGSNVTSIGDGGGSSFGRCYNLKFNEYGNCKYLGTKDNPYYALIDVTTENLSSYTIHEDTKVVSAWAFNYCERLTNIYYAGSESDWSEISIGIYNYNLTSATIHYNYVPEN